MVRVVSRWTFFGCGEGNRGREENDLTIRIVFFVVNPINIDRQIDR